MRHRSVAALAILGVVGLGVLPQVAAADTPAPDALITKGKYLVTAGDCVACHTASGGKELAGGRYIQTPFGPMASPNITPDKETGIGNWTDEQFYRALHEGIAADGTYLYPVLPYPWFTKITRDDTLAIKAYLFSLPPVHAPKQPNHLMFPFDIRLGLAAWDALFLHTGEFKPDPSKSAEYNRGAYLVEGLGHCGDCHTPKNIAEAPIRSDGYAGEPIQHWYAPNITSDVHEGIGSWSQAQLVAYLKTGVAPQGVVAGPMAETVHDSLRKMTDADVQDIALYLKTTKPEEDYKQQRSAAVVAPNGAGATAYLNYCASCHQLNGKGVPGAIPALAGNGVVNAQGPQDVIRVVLGGIEAQQNYAPMPALGASMTDQQIADVVNYVRNAWSNAAPAVAGPGMVGEIRKDTNTLLSGTRPGGCPALAQPQIKAAVDDPKSGIADLLRQTGDANLLQNTAAIADKAKAAAPGVSRADIVNALTIAYCPVVAQHGGLNTPAHRQLLTNFSELVYSHLAAGSY